MVKTLLLVLGGLAAGLTIAFWLARDAPAPLVAESIADAAPMLVAATSGPSTARLAALESALAAEAEHRAVLEQRVEELAAQLDELGQRPALAAGPRDFAGPGGGPRDPAAIADARERFQRDAGARNEEAERRFNERLVAAGFAPDRADWIIRRTEELRMEALQAQYDAQRGGRTVEPRAGLQTLRSELGDADYERYLQADRPADGRTRARRARELAGRALGLETRRRDRLLRRQARVRHARS